MVQTEIEIVILYPHGGAIIYYYCIKNNFPRRSKSWQVLYEERGTEEGKLGLPAAAPGWTKERQIPGGNIVIIPVQQLIPIF